MNVGSMPWRLSRMEPDDVEWFAVPAGKPTTAYMQQIGAAICRNFKAGEFTQERFIAVDPRTEEVVNLVRVRKTR